MDILSDPASAVANFTTGSKAAHKIMGPPDISSCCDDGPKHMAPNFKYPQSNGRRFKQDWQHFHPWIEYSVCEDKIYCFMCRHFLRTSTTYTDSGPFIKSRFDQWKKCSGHDEKNNKLLKQQRSEAHRNCVLHYEEH